MSLVTAHSHAVPSCKPRVGRTPSLVSHTDKFWQRTREKWCAQALHYSTCVHVFIHSKPHSPSLQPADQPPPHSTYTHALHFHLYHRHPNTLLPTAILLPDQTPPAPRNIGKRQLTSLAHLPLSTVRFLFVPVLKQHARPRTVHGIRFNVTNLERRCVVIRT